MDTLRTGVSNENVRDFKEDWHFLVKTAAIIKACCVGFVFIFFLYDLFSCFETVRAIGTDNFLKHIYL